VASTHLIINPASGGGRAYRQRYAIAAEFKARGVVPQIHLTDAPRHGVEIARQLSDDGADVVVAVGGDGTVHDVANGLLRSNGHAAFGVLPLGTGNDFAKVVPGSKTKPYDAIVGGKTTRYDVGKATWPSGDEFFINGMGTGIDVEVVRQIQRLPAMPGGVKYLLGLFRALAVYNPVDLGCTLGDSSTQHTVMMMAVGNGICQGGGFYLTPAARTDDGRLNLCIIDSIPMWRVPAVLPRILRGTHETHGAVSTRIIERVRFEARGANPLYFQLDGELREPHDGFWLDIEVQPAALRVLTLNM